MRRHRAPYRACLPLTAAAYKRCGPSRVARWRHRHQGRERLEPVGILVFSSVMGTASLMLIIEAVQRLIEAPNEPPDTGPRGVARRGHRGA